MKRQGRDEPGGRRFDDELTAAIREGYDPDARLDGTGVLLVRLRILGGMSGTVKGSPDGWVYAFLRSGDIIPRKSQPDVRRIFTEENQRIASSTWIPRDDGEVVLRVGGVRMRGNLERRIEKAKGRFLSRLDMMEEQIGRFFSPREADGGVPVTAER
jgi:hypothetical protein